jgi:FHS family L-fucose permease-like MFS transporter
MNFSKIENPAKIEKTVITESSDTFRVLDYPQLYLGMLAIFIYVGTEVTIISNYPLYYIP